MAFRIISLNYGKAFSIRSAPFGFNHNNLYAEERSLQLHSSASAMIASTLAFKTNRSVVVVKKHKQAVGLYIQVGHSNFMGLCTNP